MTCEQLTDKVAEYLMSNVAPNMTSAITRFTIGAACSESGKKIMCSKIKPFVSYISDPCGNFSADEIKDMLTCGVNMSGKISILGGLVILDEKDVAKFCEGL